MKKLSLLLVAALISIVAQAWTVSFTNPKNWAEVAVWAWAADGTNFTGGTWPGKLMTKSGDVWTYTGDGAPSKIIFNNNGKGEQTGNLDFVDGATYDFYGPVGVQLTDYTVKFDNSLSDWSDVYVYTFSPELAGVWPGTKLSKGADGLYEWTTKATSEPSIGGIIFNNGPGAQQTANLEYKAGTTYDKNGPVGATLNRYTMGFNNSASNWEKVYVYTFEPELCGSWPGTELTKGDDNVYTWIYEGVSEPSVGGIIFSNGEGAQTDDLPFENGKVVSMGEVVTPGGPMTIYWDNAAAQWETPLVHYWGETESAWPGEPMTKVEGNIWSYDLPAGITGILFNAGGENPDATKTADFVPVANHVYTQSGDAGDYSEYVPVVVVEKKLYLIGAFNGWALLDENYKFTKEGDVYTLELPNGFDGSEGWKINDGTWAWSFGAGASQEVPVGENVETWFDAQVNFVGKYAGKTTITFTLVAGSDVKDSSIPSIVNVTMIPTSVSEVLVADEGEAIYFNLQGVKVANPEKGIYVKVVEGKATKVVL